MRLVWLTQAARGFATSASPVSYVLGLKLRDPAAAGAFAAHGPVNRQVPCPRRDQRC